MDTALLARAYDRLLAATRPFTGDGGSATALEAPPGVGWRLAHIALSDRTLARTARQVLAGEPARLDNTTAMSDAAIAPLLSSLSYGELAELVRRNARELLDLLTRTPEALAGASVDVRLVGGDGEPVFTGPVSWGDVIRMRTEEQIPGHRDALAEAADTARAAQRPRGERDGRAPGTVLIVANPRAGSAHPALVDDVVRRCEGLFQDVAVHTTTRQGCATDAVRAAVHEGTRRPAVVLAVGGDGTVREVVEGMVAGPRQPATVLGIVPAGTGNSAYRMLWDDLPWQEALVATAPGPGDPAGAEGVEGVEGAEGAEGVDSPRSVDVIRVAETGAPALLGVGTGAIAEALEEVQGTEIRGRERYRRAFAARVSAGEPYPGRVTVDGTVLHEGGTVFVNVGGGRIRGGQYLVLPHSRFDDGLLDICVIDAAVPASVVTESTLTGGHLGVAGVAYGRGRRVTIERTDGQPLSFECDGEPQPRDRQSVTLEVLPGAVSVGGTAAAEGAVAG